jgi:hypothetical protein
VGFSLRLSESARAISGLHFMGLLSAGDNKRFQDEIQDESWLFKRREDSIVLCISVTECVTEDKKDRT